MEQRLFEAALGIEAPWFVKAVDLDVAARVLTIRIDFRRGGRFRVSGVEGEHPVHDTVEKRYRHLNFFQHECHLVVHVPWVRLPDGRVRQVEPPWAGRLGGFTLLFEVLVLTLAREMPFAAVARLVGESWHRVMAVCRCYVRQARARADLSGVRVVAVDETSRARRHEYVTVVADAEREAVIFVCEGRDATAIGRLAAELRAQGGRPEAIRRVSIDMSPAYIAGCEAHLPRAEIVYDKFHVIAQASRALDETRRREQREAPELKGLRWKLLRARAALGPAERAELEAALAKAPGRRTAQAWRYRERLREILDLGDAGLVRRLLRRWAHGVLRSQVEPMKAVARMVLRHLDGIVAWVERRQTNAFLEVVNGLFQTAKRAARGYRDITTIETVFFLRAGKLDFSAINPHLARS